MEEKLSILSELINLAKSDKLHTKEEYIFLSTVAKQLGISKEEFDKLYKKKAVFTPPKEEFDRILQFQRLVLLMIIDANMDEQELILVRNLGIRMGLNPIATERVLEDMHDYPNKIIPPEKLIEIFKQHHN